MATQQSTESVSPMPPGVTDPNYKPEPGHLGNLTAEQQNTLDRLRETLQKDKELFVPERMDDAMLLRFLRARKFDFDKTLEMLINSENWRKEFKVDELVKDFKFSDEESKVLDTNFPQYYHKTDKDGRPIYIQDIRKINYSEIEKVTTPERQLQNLVVEYEKFLSDRLPACSKAVGHPVETSCTILIIENIPWWSLNSIKSYLKLVAEVSQNNYPETMGKFYVVNTPGAITKIWGWVKNFIDPVTASKVQLLGASESAALLAQIEKENIPKSLKVGGECECEGGCSLSDAGPWNMPQETAA